MSEQAPVPNNSASYSGRLLTAKEVADRLSVTEETVRRWVRQHVIAGIRLPGGSRRLVRIAEAELERLLAEGSPHD